MFSACYQPAGCHVASTSPARMRSRTVLVVRPTGACPSLSVDQQKVYTPTETQCPDNAFCSTNRPSNTSPAMRSRYGNIDFRQSTHFPGVNKRADNRAFLTDDAIDRVVDFGRIVSVARLIPNELSVLAESPFRGGTDFFRQFRQTLILQEKSTRHCQCGSHVCHSRNRTTHDNWPINASFGDHLLPRRDWRDRVSSPDRLPRRHHSEDTGRGSILRMGRDELGRHPEDFSRTCGTVFIFHSCITVTGFASATEAWSMRFQVQ
ncbi:unnamed protein product [Protopolystoma xenopodis]|uniref:Uncharacterized protein n=1 Tax=Protopolystoma xenopodis TaxID=117903 RepID=A0A3S4ZTP9_9PLAT|nr:unnamed protein product [Protopolystoma xenopodis]